MKKFIFYSTFAAIGVFWAEVISTNAPYALVIPPLYLAYGLLYVFFIDALIRYGERRFILWYILGAWVGLITETYVAKVTFFGLSGGSGRVLGVAPGPIMFVILFYHAFFSFMVPAYFAKRILNMPLPITPRKWIDALYLIIPFILWPVVDKDLISRGWNIMLLMKFISISGIMLLGWFVVLRSTHEIKNILLTKKERIVLFLFTIFIYIIFLFKATNKRAHGYAPMDFPLIPMLVVTFIIIGVLILVFKNLKMNGRAVECVSYSPKSIRWSLFFFWYFWHFSVTAILLLFHIKLQPLSRLMLILVGLLGAATGALLFLWSVFYLTKKLILRKQ